MPPWIIDLLQTTGPTGLGATAIIMFGWVVRGMVKDKADSWGPLLFMAVCSKDRRTDLIRLEQSRRGKQADDDPPEIEPPDTDDTDRDDGS